MTKRQNGTTGKRVLSEQLFNYMENDDEEGWD
jgi:hypothetical protein